MSGRGEFLQRVRQAVSEGNRAGVAPALPERGRLGEQGGGADPVEHFGQALVAAGGCVYRASEVAEARTQVLALVAARPAKRILLGRGPVIDSLNLEGPLRERGLHVACTDAAQ